MRRLAMMAVVALLPGWVMGQRVAPQAAAEQPRTITVSGEALVNVVPDEVIVRLGIETFSTKLEESKAANDAAATSLVKAIKALGVEDKHLQTDQVWIEVQYKDGGVRAGVAGYLARRGYTVTLQDPKKYEELISTALKSGANVLMGHEFRTTELRKHRDQARAMAIKAAREKAVALAEGLGCSIGAPRSINESPVYSTYWGYWGYWGGWGRNYGGGMSQNVMQDAGGAGPGDSGTEAMQVGRIGIRAQVSVVFDLVPGGEPVK